MTRWLGLLLAAAMLQGCVVVSLQPVYDDDTLAWEDGLLGRWRDAEDNVEVTVERGEWRSYKVHYKHPVEEADFTARLTAIGDAYFLDLMPVRGLDYGAVLIPAHLVVRVARDGDKWRVSGLDYDRLREQVKAGRQPAFATTDQRQNVVLTGSTAALRAWLRARDEKDFTAPATFERIDK
jgi:hypothetical protein